MSIVKKVHTTYQTELRQHERRELERRKKQGDELYNSQAIFTSYYSYGQLLWLLANEYCKEHIGKRVDQYLNGNEANKEYRCMLLLYPDQSEELKAKYEDVISYKNKCDYYRSAFGIDYDDYISLPENERPRLRPRTTADHNAPGV